MSQENQEITFFVLNTPLINYYFYKAPLTQNGPNVPLAGGFLYFFDNEDQTTLVPIYSDVSDPQNPVEYPNPIQLGAAGDCPPIYLKGDQVYYIVITDLNQDLQNPIATIPNYNPGENEGGGNVPSGSGTQNMFANGQFSYPIEFWQTNDTPGLITNTETTVAWGWQFNQDEDTATENVINFNLVSNEGIEGDPLYEVILNSSNVNSAEQNKFFSQVIGSASYLAGQSVTISMQLQSKIAATPQVVVKVIKDYGDGGSPSTTEAIATFTINDERQKYTANFVMPSNEGKTLGPNNFTVIAIQMSLGQICIIGMTNVLGLVGSVADPIYVPAPNNDTVTQILGQSTQISEAGLPQNQSFYMYNEGDIFPYADTGTLVICPIGSIQPFRLQIVESPSSLNVSDYINGIPNERLYNVIGNTFGGSGDIITSASNNVVSFRSGTGARPKTDFGAGTAPVTVAQINKGLDLGVSGVLSSANSVTLTWVEDGAINQTVSNYTTGYLGPADGNIGNWFNPEGANYPSPVISTVNISSGSSMTAASSTILFNSLNALDYYTQSFPIANGTKNFLEFPATSSDVHGTYPSFNSLVLFSADGFLENTGVTGVETVTVPFLSSNTLLQNINIFLKTVNVPFLWTVTLNSVPLSANPNLYFLYSSAGTDYYLYFVVDGASHDPAIAGRTGVPCAINSTDSVQTVAIKIVNATNSLTFTPPATTDLPTIPSNTELAWYINQ